MTIRYISDPHFGHTNIIRFAARPFKSVGEMNAVLLRGFLEAAASGTLVCAGDLCFNPVELPVPELPNAADHLLVLGNHDPVVAQSARSRDVRARQAYRRWFGTLVGCRTTWKRHGVVMPDTLDGQRVRVLVSHEPQPPDDAWDYNVYGHHHNNLVRFPEDYGPGGTWGDYTWLRGSPRHLNACVEIVNYVPRSLEELRVLGVWT